MERQIDRYWQQNGQTDTDKQTDREIDRNISVYGFSVMKVDIRFCLHHFCVGKGPVRWLKDIFRGVSGIHEWVDCLQGSHREWLLTLVCEGCPEDTTFPLTHPEALYYSKLTRNTLIENNVKSLKSTVRLVPGICLNPLKCWTAQFTGLGCRLTWVLRECVECSPTLFRTTCKYIKKTVHGA